MYLLRFRSNLRELVLSTLHLGPRLELGFSDLRASTFLNLPCHFDSPSLHL